MERKLTVKQRKFCELYLELGNGTQAAVGAGYMEANAAQTASEILNYPHIQAYIQELLDETKSKRIATIEEVMEFYTKVMRGEEKDQFGLDTAMSDRLKAGQELVKRLSIVGDDDGGTRDMQSLADLINNPQENRNIADFEGGEDNE